MLRAASFLTLPPDGAQWMQRLRGHARDRRHTRPLRLIVEALFELLPIHADAFVLAVAGNIKVIACTDVK